MAFALPSLLNLGYSAWRHLWLDDAKYEALIPGNPTYADLQTPSWERPRIGGTISLPGETGDAELVHLDCEPTTQAVGDERLRDTGALGRDFVCGCGKKYLSYPALYTHIKTKHEGRQPEGTMKYSTTAPAKKSKTKLE